MFANMKLILWGCLLSVLVDVGWVTSASKPPLGSSHVGKWVRYRKSIRVRYFKLDRDEIWHGCSSHKCGSTDRVGFLI